MKKLFKSSFFSFMKSKVSITILIIVVFFATATFTLITSSAAAFKKSYQTLTTTTKMHDLIGKEKYDLNGQLKFKQDPMKKGVDGFAAKEQEGRVDHDLKYIYFTDELDSSDPSGKGFGFRYQGSNRVDTKVTVPMRLKLDELNIDTKQDDNGNWYIDSVAPRSGQLNFEVPLIGDMKPYSDGAGNLLGYHQTAASDWHVNVADVSSSKVTQYEWVKNGVNSWHDSKTPGFFDFGYKATGVTKSDFAQIKPGTMSGGVMPKDKLTVGGNIVYSGMSRKTLWLPHVGGEKYFAVSSKQDLINDYINQPTTNWIQVPNLVVDKSMASDSDLIPQNTPANGYAFHSDYDYEDFLSRLTTVLGNYNYFGKTKVDTVRIYPDRVNSTGIYKTLLAKPAVGSANEIYNRIQAKMTELGFNKDLQVGGPGIDHDAVLANVEEQKKIISSYIKNYAADQKRQNYISMVKNDFRDDLDIKYTNTVSVSDEGNVFKVVETDGDKQVMNNVHVYNGYKFPENYAEDKMYTSLANKIDMEDGKKDGFPTWTRDKNDNSKILWDWGTQKNGVGDLVIAGNKLDTKRDVPIINKSRGYKWVANWNVETKAAKGALGVAVQLSVHTIPHVVSVTDPSSYFTYVSPSYFANKGLVAIDPKEILNDPSLEKMLLENPNALFEKYPNSVVKVGLLKYLVIGSAVQPDFAFPVINAANPIPNTNSQAIITTSDIGYKRVFDSYRNNDQENYFSFRFKHSMSDSDKEKVQVELEKKSRQMMSWPSNINVISKADDADEQVLLAPQRTNVLNKLQHSVSTISFTVSAMLIVFTGFIITLVVKRQVSARKKSYGILMANGYTKWQIALANLSLPLIAIAIPSILGYITGHFMQFLFIDLFMDQWTIPISQTAFSWPTLLLTVGTPLIIGSAFVVSIGLWELKGRLLNVLSGSESKFGAAISTSTLRLFAFTNIKTKVAISLFTTNISKMFMIILAVSSAVISLTVGFTMLNKFTYAHDASVNKESFAFKVALDSPTDEGGLYRQTDPQHIGGVDWSNESPEDIYKNHFYENSKGSVDSSSFHLPSDQDEAQIVDQSTALKYLDNKIETQSLLDVTLGSSVPWDVAKVTMPEGQKVVSEQQTKAFYQFGLSLNKISNANDPKGNIKNIKRIVNEVTKSNRSWIQLDGDKNVVYDSMPNKDYMGIKLGDLSNKRPGYQVTDAYLSDSYKQFFINTYQFIVNNKNNFDKYKGNLPYFISYRNIDADASDESYTRIDAKYQGPSIANKGKDKIESISVLGIKEDSKNVNLSEKSIEALKTFDMSNGEIPIVTNAYFNKIYTHKVGDVFDMGVTNTSDRLAAKAKGLASDKKMKFKIVSTVESYNGSKIYTLQDVANKALGYDSLTNDKTREFNGLFSKSENPIVFSQLSLYSESGVYPPTDTIVDGSNTESMITKAINSRKDVSVSDGLKLKNRNIENMLDYYRVYTKSPFVLVWSNPEWNKISDYAFESILGLSSDIVAIMEAVTIVIAILFIAIVTMMLIDSNKKFISTMKVMGYRSREIGRIFAKLFWPSVLLSAIIAVGLIFGIFGVLQLVIINFGSIYIPISMVGWEMITAISIIIVLMTVIYISASRQLKGQKVLQAFSAS